MSKYVISSFARIHFGFLELNPGSKRIFGSLGLSVTGFNTVLKASKSDKLKISGYNDEKIKSLIKKLSSHIYVPPCKINIIKITPSHCGLGSGTQLALSLGVLLSKISGNEISVDEIAKILNRGNRSGIGIGCFKNGGFNVDAGRPANEKILPKIIFKNKWPIDWKILLIFDNSFIGIHGEKEINEFRKITKISSTISDKNCKSLIMEILAGIVEKNFEILCSGIQKIQENTGEIFKKSQGGKYSSKKIESIFKNLKRKGHKGFGQSSWGPTGFVLCKDKDEQNRIIIIINKFLEEHCINYIDIVKCEANNNSFLIEKEDH